MVSFVLFVARPHLPDSRPLRVLAAYASAFAVHFAAILISFDLFDGPRAHLVLMICTALILVLPIMTNRLLGFRSYPKRWW